MVCLCGVYWNWHGVERYIFLGFVIVGAFVAIPRLTQIHDYVVPRRPLPCFKIFSTRLDVSDRIIWCSASIPANETDSLVLSKETTPRQKKLKGNSSKLVHSIQVVFA